MKIKKKFVQFLRLPAILRGLREGGESWVLQDAASLDDYQLQALNEVWKDAVENVPFYKWWKEQHHLPDRIASLEDYAKWPILSKNELQKHQELTKRNTTRRFHASVTGGATGEPLRFGTFPEHGQRVNACMLMARAGLDFLPGDRVFLFWGHRHFYGHGIQSKIKFFFRRCKDWLNNTYRADACDLSPQYLSFILKKLSHYRPEVIVSYSASLRVLVRYAKEKNVRLELPELKCIVCTAGPLLAEERKEVSTYLGAPVYMEYGAMDAGQMAYMARDGRYHVFHHCSMLHTENDGMGELTLATTLTKEYLPLFRYKIGDYLQGCTYTKDGRVLTIKEVYGRGSDVVELPSGSRFQVQTFMVCAEELPKILAYQLLLEGEKLTFCIQVTSPLTDEERTIISEKAYSIVGELRDVGFEIVEKDELIKAPSGKIRLLVKI